MRPAGQGVWAAGLIASGVLEVIALLGLLVIVATTAIQGPKFSTRPALQKVAPLLVGVFASLGLAAIINLVNVAHASVGPIAGLVPATGDSMNVTLGLLGFLVPMALTMSAQTLPMYAGLEPFPRQLFWPLAVGYFGGLALALLGIGLGVSWLTGLGTALLGLVLLIFVSLFIRLMRTRGKLPQRVAKLAPQPDAAALQLSAAGLHRPQRLRAIRGAGGERLFLGDSGRRAAGDRWRLATHGSGALFSPDAARHSLALGFIALLICGIAPRMAPGFSGGHIRSARLVTATLWLGNSAALLRVGSLLVAPLLDTLGPTGAFVDSLLFGLSGPLGLALAICLAVNLWPALFSRKDTKAGG